MKEHLTIAQSRSSSASSVLLLLRQPSAWIHGSVAFSSTGLRVRRTEHDGLRSEKHADDSCSRYMNGSS